METKEYRDFKAKRASISAGLGVILVIGALVVVLSFGSLAYYKYFAPKWEAARTDVYRETKSYVEGTIRDLRQLKREYTTVDDVGKIGLKTLILQRADELDWSRLPDDLRLFIEKLDSN